MLLNDLRNKKQEHKEIKKLLKEYGYTVKTPIYGNSAKKALQQIKDAKQDLYRDFTTEEYNRVILFEKYLEQLIEQPTVDAVMTAAELAAEGLKKYRINIPGNVANAMNQRNITIKPNQALSKAEQQAILKAAHEAEERASRQALIKKLAKEVGDKSAWQITKILMAKIAARHAIATGASIWTGPGTIAVNAGMLGWDAYEIYKLAKLVRQVYKLNKLRKLDKAVDAVDTAADVASATATASTATKVAATGVTVAAVGTVVVPSLGMYPNLNEIQDIPKKERDEIRKVNEDIDRIIREGNPHKKDIETNRDIIENQKWQEEQLGKKTPADITEIPNEDLKTIPSTEKQIDNTDIKPIDFAGEIQEVTERDKVLEKYLDELRKASDKAKLDQLDDIDDDAEDAARTDTTTKELPAPEETTTEPKPIYIDLEPWEFFEIEDGDTQEQIEIKLEQYPHEFLPVNVEVVDAEEPDAEKTDVKKWEPTPQLPAPVPVKVITPHGWKFEFPKLPPPKPETKHQKARPHDWRYNALQVLRRQKKAAEKEKEAEPKKAIDLTKAADAIDPDAFVSQTDIIVPKPGTDLTKAADAIDPDAFVSQKGIVVPKPGTDLTKAVKAIDTDAFISQKGIVVPKPGTDLTKAIKAIDVVPEPVVDPVVDPVVEPITRRDPARDRHPEEINWEEKRRQQLERERLAKIQRERERKQEQEADQQELIIPKPHRGVEPAPQRGRNPEVQRAAAASTLGNIKMQQGGGGRGNTGRGKKAKPWGFPMAPSLGMGNKSTGARDISQPPLQTYLSLGPRLKRDSGWVGGVINSSIIRRGNVMNEEATFKNLKKLLEQDLDQAELALAAKDMVVQLQDIAEDLAKMQVENLMPLVDRIKEEYGPEAGEQFNSSVEAALGSALDGIKGTHEQVQDAVLVLTGDKPAMSTDMGMGTDDMAMDMDDTDMDDGLGSDDEISLDGADAAAGPADMSLGRAVKKESVVKAKRALQTALREGKYNDKVLRQIIKSMK